MIGRREFISSSALFAASGVATKAVGGAAHAPHGPVRMRLGVLSDIHVTDERSCRDFEKALRTFDGWKADGVLLCGDIADWGIAPQLKLAADTWFRVFPGNRRSDGQPIANLLHYGDHDTSGYTYRGCPPCVKEYPDEEEMKKLIIPLNDRKKIWEDAFQEPWAPLVHKKVAGYDFVLSHFTRGEPGNKWGNNVPGLEEFLAGLDLDPTRPFFYSQHRIPRNTAGGPYIYGQDDGKTTALFSRKYPNVCVFCGHCHLSCTEEKAVWQGDFTAVEVPSLSYCVTLGGRENGYSCEDKVCPPLWQMPVSALGPARQVYLVSVYDDEIFIRRHEVNLGMPLGPDWRIPLPLLAGKPYCHAARAKAEPAPQFGPNTKITVEAQQIKDRQGTERNVFMVKFPPARSTSSSPRACDYEVQVEMRVADVTRIMSTKRVYSTKFMFPEEKDTVPVCCAFSTDEVPKGKQVRFLARPCSAFGVSGAMIVTPWEIRNWGKT